MPSFLFKGFSLGSPVAISVAQGALSDSASVASWGEGNGSMSINISTATEITAPAGVWFDVDFNSLSGFDANPPSGNQTYDPRYHEITYIWSFDDPGSHTPALNMPSVWNNRNIAYGPKVAHVFSAPGTYTVSVWAIDRVGNTGTAQVAVTVVDADTVYPASRTIYYDSGSDWDDAPAGCTKVSTLSATQSAINALDPTSGRLLIARGTSTNNATISFDGRSIQLIGPRGSGARPILSAPNSDSDASILNFGNEGGTDQVTIHGLDLRGGWDSVNQTGPNDHEPWKVRTFNADCFNVFYDCKCSGFVWVEPVGDKDNVSTCIVSDLDITNWNEFGIWGNQQAGGSCRLAIVGSAVYRDPNASSGGSGINFNENNHGPIRIGDVDECYIGATEFFSRSGHSGGPPPAVQPCMRLNTNGIADVYYNIERVCAEGGGTEVITAKPANPNIPEFPGNYIFDKCLGVATAHTRTNVFNTRFGGTTLRNCIAVIPNAPSEQTSATFEIHNGFGVGAEREGGNNYDQAVSIYNCTAVNLRNTANDSGHVQTFSVVAGAFSNVTHENNVLHAPNMDTPQTADAPIDLSESIVGFTSRMLGLRYGGASMDTTYASPSNVPLPRPATGSAALNGGGLGLIAYDDFLLAVRGDPGTRGALEPS